MISIYLAGTDIGESEYKRIYGLLPSFRKEKIMRIKSGEAQKESALAFGLLQYALKEKGIIENFEELESWKLSLGEHGKPFFENKTDIFFSLSHTRGRVMCVLADDEVGCDIECIKKNRKQITKLYERFFSAEEIDVLRKLDDDLCIKEFYRIWTKKESYVKWNGAGMTHSFDEFSVYKCQPLPKTVFEDSSHISSICCCDSDYSLKEIHWKKDE